MKDYLFISDLHLSADNLHLQQLFSHFLTHHANSAAALYILGDLFEVWMGDDVEQAWSDHIASQLAALAEQQVKVYLMQGNRDFLLGKQFAAKAKAVLLPDPTTIEVYGKKILLKHGDDLCTLDWQHQWFRKISRSTLVKKLYLALPAGWRQRIAQRIRGFSSRHNQHKTAAMLDVVPQAIVQQFATNRVDMLLHGHTHNPSIHYLWLENHYNAHIVLSDWGQQGNFMRLAADGSFKLTYFAI